jgi:hypothetical protein
MVEYTFKQLVKNVFEHMDLTGLIVIHLNNIVIRIGIGSVSSDTEMAEILVSDKIVISVVPYSPGLILIRLNNVGGTVHSKEQDVKQHVFEEENVV